MWKDFLKGGQIGFASKEGEPLVSEHLYQNRQQLETVFRMIDEDCSGFLSREEFNKACTIVNKVRRKSVHRGSNVCSLPVSDEYSPVPSFG